MAEYTLSFNRTIDEINTSFGKLTATWMRTTGLLPHDGIQQYLILLLSTVTTGSAGILIFQDKLVRDFYPLSRRSCLPDDRDHFGKDQRYNLPPISRLKPLFDSAHDLTQTLSSLGNQRQGHRNPLLSSFATSSKGQRFCEIGERKKETSKGTNDCE